jgi:hypothetical protein
MSDQPEALFLADVIENDPQSKAHHDAAAACLRRLHAEVEAMRADYGNACKLVVDIHAAATGRPGEGPRLGVVEDVAAVRAECDALRAQVADFHAMWEVNSKGFAKVEAERDALRSELATLRAENYNTQSLLAGAAAEVDALREELDRLKEAIPAVLTHIDDIGARGYYSGKTLEEDAAIEVLRAALKETK